ncbi:MAG: hypothetical protein ABW168_15845 [Sedimenticola sp.]
MKIAVTEDARKQAKFPHDLYMTNMFLFNMVTLTLTFTIGGDPILLWSVVGCMLLSLGITGNILKRASPGSGEETLYSTNKSI